MPSHPREIEWVREKAPYPGMSDCMVVTSHAPTSSGYIRISRGPRGASKETPLHRLICERRHGPLGKLMATHSCDNRRCINPDHLVPGTGKKNMEGAVERDRVIFGEKMHSAVLTTPEVREILKLLGHGHSTRAIAKRFGVDRATISDIKARRTWRRVSI